MFVWAILTLWSQKNFRELSENFTFANWKFDDPAFVQIFKSAQIERMSKFEIIWDVKILKISYAFRTNKIIDVHDIFYPQVENFTKVSQLVPVRVRIRSTLSLKKSVLASDCKWTIGVTWALKPTGNSSLVGWAFRPWIFKYRTFLYRLVNRKNFSFVRISIDSKDLKGFGYDLTFNSYSKIGWMKEWKLKNPHLWYLADSSHLIFSRNIYLKILFIWYKLYRTLAVQRSSTRYWSVYSSTNLEKSFYKSFLYSSNKLLLLKSLSNNKINTLS